MRKHQNKCIIVSAGLADCGYWGVSPPPALLMLVAGGGACSHLPLLQKRKPLFSGDADQIRVVDFCLQILLQIELQFPRGALVDLSGQSLLEEVLGRFEERG